MEEIKYVELICVKQGSKLRVKILTLGYLANANCQFPRDIRIEGLRYKVKADDVKLITARGRWFYSVKKKDAIEILNPNQLEPNQLQPNPINIQIYEDQTEVECLICMTEPKNTVFYPCGHYHACAKCACMVNNCPMCMKKIENRIDRGLID
jgi:hypothetical protein